MGKNRIGNSIRSPGVTQIPGYNIFQKGETEMSEQSVKEASKIHSFSGMTAEEISKYINENGLKVSELEQINAALKEDEAREEAEYLEAFKVDYHKFRCHAVELKMSIPLWDANSYTGELYTRGRCESDARTMLRGLYKEAEDALGHDKLYQAAMDEITGYITDHFKDRTDTGKVLDDIGNKLRKIKINGLKDFSDYNRLVTYDNVGEDADYEGIAEIISGLFSGASKSWSFSCYEAYRELDRDFSKAARAYARAATDITIAALETYTEKAEEETSK